MIKPYIVDIRNLDYTQLSQLIERMKKESPSGLMINPGRSHMVMFYEGPEYTIPNLASILNIQPDRLTILGTFVPRDWRQY